MEQGSQSDTRRARHAVPLRMWDAKGADVGVEEGEELLAEEEGQVPCIGEEDEKFIGGLDFGRIRLDFRSDGVHVVFALEKEHRHLKAEAEGTGVKGGEVLHQGLKAGHGNSARVERGEALGEVRGAWWWSAHRGEDVGVESGKDSLLGGRHGIGVFILGSYGVNGAVGRRANGFQFRDGWRIA